MVKDDGGLNCLVPVSMRSQGLDWLMTITVGPAPKGGREGYDQGGVSSPALSTPTVLWRDTSSIPVEEPLGGIYGHT